LSFVLLLARLVLVAVFATAGITKLVDLSASRRAVADFGIPTAWVRSTSLALPLIELAIAFALLPSVSAPYAAIAAASLFLVFIAAILSNLARGHSPDCHCLGQLYSEPVGPGTVVRNAALGVIAVCVAVVGWSDPGPSVTTPIRSLTNTQQLALEIGIGVLAILVAQGWLLFKILEGQSQLLARLMWVEQLLTNGDTVDFGGLGGRDADSPDGAASEHYQMSEVGDES
jgi:uncharacterized membrane protein YphA (DoxX/SURF4 family)